VPFSLSARVNYQVQQVNKNAFDLKLTPFSRAKKCKKKKKRKKKKREMLLVIKFL
jgi:hypothetical protein